MSGRSSHSRRRTPRIRQRALASAVATALLAGAAALAHHPITAKFDPAKPRELEGIVTAVDWRNPHVHVFVNVSGPRDSLENWAVELESPIILEKSGWSRDSLKPGDSIAVDGIVARNGTRQIWGESVVQSATGRKVLFAVDTAPIPPLQKRPTPKWEDGTVRLGAIDGAGGYWGYPTSTVLMEAGANVEVDEYGLLRNVADAAKVAPMQPWALELYKHRQTRALQDDPTYINCKPPGGVRHLQSDLGIQLVEDRVRQRVFVLMGSGNNNFRIMFLDGRTTTGNVRGDDDNPLYYGRSIGKWEGDTLVVETKGFNEDFWFTNGGLPHTNQLVLTERFSRPDFDTLHYEVTVNDPGAYTRPWNASWDLKWVGGETLPSHFCQDNRS